MTRSRRDPLGRALHAAWLVLTLRRPRGLRVSPLFDDRWYRDTYDDVPAGRRAAWTHYREQDAVGTREPNAYFDTRWYLGQHPDVAASGLHPLDHYFEFGALEGRDPSPTFDSAQYLRYHPEASELGMNPVEHAIRSGRDGTLPRRSPLGGLLGSELGVLADKTLSHYRRFGLRRTAAKVAERLGQREPALEDRAIAPVVTEVEPERVKATLERPRLAEVEDGAWLTVSGWAHAPGGIGSVELHLDGELVGTATIGTPRPDVAALRDTPPEAMHSGFAARLRLPGGLAGTHALQVVVRAERGYVRVLVRPFESMPPGTLYHRYHRRSLPTAAEQRALDERIAARADAPVLHIVVVDTGRGDLSATLASIDMQSYPHWSRTILTSADRVGSVEAELLAIPGTSAPPWSIATEVLDALPASRAQRRYVAFVHRGEVLAPAALLTVATADTRADIRLIYSDHDHVTETGRHVDPWFVGDWAPEHLLAQDYVGGVFFVRDDDALRVRVARLLASAGPAWRYELLLPLRDEPGRIAHIPQVLWSAPLESNEADDRAVAEAEAVVAALQDDDEPPEVTTSRDGPDGPVRRITWPLPVEPLVSVIVPTTGRADLVEGTLALLERTAYPQVEPVFIDNGRGEHREGIDRLRRSGATVIERDQPFNWAALSNDGAAEAHGELLLFLNDDLATEDPDWLTELVRVALRPDVGAVGAMLRYPDGRIQHAGVFTVGHGGGAVHLFHGLSPDERLHLDLQHVTREVSAVTGACLIVSRRDFRAVGGFDEDLAVVGNDVDLCLRLRRRGKRIIWTPAASLTHRESASRAAVDHLPDEDRMWRRWSSVLEEGDPYHNPNLAPDRVDAAVDWRRVADRTDPVSADERARGVNLVGYISAEMGVGEATRGEAEALTSADIPFGIIDYRYGNPSRMGDLSWSHMVIDEPVYATNLIHINADLLPAALERLPRELRTDRRTIGIWTWELGRFPQRFHPAFELVDEVWVPSGFVRDAVAIESPVPVRVVPHVVAAPSRPPLERSHFSVPVEGYRYLTFYDTQSVRARKNPGGAVDAYRRAFPRPTDDVHLVVKVNNASDEELAWLAGVIGDRRDIHVLADVLTRHEVDSLVATCDAFISLHRSEGFGLVIAEAMAMARPVVATGWSGNVDFMSVETSALVDYTIVELEQAEGPYDAGERWAEPDYDDAAEWLRKLHDDPAAAARMGARAADAIARRHSPEVIGRIIAANLSEPGADASTRPTDARPTLEHASSPA